MSTKSQRSEYQKRWYHANLERARAIGRKSAKKYSADRKDRNIKWRKENPDAVREYARQFKARHPERYRQQKRESYQRCKEKHQATGRAYRLRNPEKIKAMKRAWQVKHTATHKEEIRIKNRARYLRKKDHMSAVSATWKKNNKVKVLEMTNRRRAMKVAATTEDCEAKIKVLQSHRFCHWCCAAIPHGKVTIDHVTPLARGGKHCPDNLVAACGACNSSKGTKLVSEWTWEMAA